MYELYIANKNYSSWSLRSWALLHELKIPFREHLIYFGDAASWDAYRRISPTGKVPCLIDGDTVVWDSLAIAEYVAERHPAVWPSEPRARAWARSAAAEMHSGFSELRNRCSMSCGLRMRLHEVPDSLRNDLARIDSLWAEGLSRFGGPFLGGSTFTAVDAFFAPVAFRVQTYGLPISSTAASYVQRLLTLDSLQHWYAAGIKESIRDLPHERDIQSMGTVLQDLRTG